MGIDCSNATLFLYRILAFQNLTCNNLSPMVKGVFARGCFQHVLPPRSVHGGNGLEETKQKPRQVLRAGVRVPENKGQYPKSTLERENTL